MADGAQRPITNSTSVILKKSDEIIDPRLVECYICTERLKQPKTLPCLHTFCQTCLEKSIAEQFADNIYSTKTTFLCPSCEKAVTPIDGAEDRSLWAEGFPTYGLVLAAMKTLDLKTEEQFCTPCYRRDTKTKATCWCKQCDVKICPGCRDTHDLFFITHDIIALADVKPMQMAVSMACNRHKETLKLYCVDHSCLGCTICMAIGHRKCETVRTSTEQVRGDEMKNKISMIKHQFSESITKLSKLETRSEDCSKSALHRKEIKLEDLKQLRKDIDIVLDNIQARTKTAIKRSYALESSYFERKTSTIQRQKSISERSLDMLKFALEVGEESAIINEVQTRSEECDDLNTMIQTEEQAGFKNEITSMKIPEYDLHLLFGMIRSMKNFKDFVPSKASLIGLIDLKDPSCRISGVLLLQNSCIVLVIHNRKKLLLRNSRGEKIAELKTGGTPWDLCLVDNSTIAVSVSSTKSIAMISINGNTMSIDMTLKLKFKPYGIAYGNGMFLVTCPFGSENIYVLNTHGEEIMRLWGVSDIWHTTFLSQTTFFISRTVPNKDAPIVYSFQDGTLKTLVRNQLVTEPRGVDADVNGNLFICGTCSSNVLMINANGEATCLLSRNDGLKEPYAVSVLGTKMAVVEEGRGLVRIYRLI